MRLKDLIVNSVRKLNRYNFGTERLDVDILLMHVLSCTRADLILKADQELSEEQRMNFDKLLDRRENGEPIAYITGEKGFYKHTFVVRPGVLIPRPETELLVELALDWIRENNKQNLTILDLGCGSGCIGLCVINELPQAKLIAIDKSDIALEVTEMNAKRLKLKNRTQVLKANITDNPFYLDSDAYDIELIVANPPYVNRRDPDLDMRTLKHEPEEALFAREAGLADIYLWMRRSTEILPSGGLLLMEIGSQQGKNVIEFLELENLFSRYEILKDLAGKDRAVRCIK